MSYVLLGYAIDIDKLNSLVGSSDLTVLESVIENDPEVFDLEKDYEDDDELPLAEAVRQLVMEEEKDPEEAHQYGYALKEICECFGEPLLCRIWSGVRWGAVQACGLDRLLTKTGAPVELPPHSDFPYIGHIRREDVGDYLQAARTLLKKSPDSEVEELLDEYVYGLETVIAKGQDVVYFYH